MHAPGTDPLRHPDLVEIDGRVRERFARVSEAEQAAAAWMAQRRATVRDRIVEAEAAGWPVRITSRSRQWLGVVSAVGADHVEVSGATIVVVPFRSIDALEVAPPPPLTPAGTGSESTKADRPPLSR